MEFYITTPIYYVNDKPHIGHAYTTIVADTIARWRAAQGEAVTFSTGVDENSQKTVDAARKNNEEIHAYIDRMAETWSSTWAKLGISNTDFIRTTEERHVEIVKDIWGRIEAAGDLYKGMYEGLYCKGHEAFIKESDLVDGLCPEHKTEPELVKEENYFFRLSEYQQRLMEFYETHQEFVVPANRYREVMSFVEDGLEDVSFSREGKEWGIPVPNDPHQAIYVWADALVNYISMVGIEGWENHPADVHTVGKDILRFHAVIWPAMLMSAGLPLPGQIAANGFLTVGGTKMSKSLGNGVDPLDLAARYGIDAMRYFLLREVQYGEDGDYSETKMKDRYNSDLANGLGNFAARVLTVAEKLPLAIVAPAPEFTGAIKAMRAAVHEKLTQFRFSDALGAVWAAIAFGDRYVNEEKIWELEEGPARTAAMSNLIALLEAVARELVPFMPETARKIGAAIAHDGDAVTIKKPEILFPRMK
ncbi:MAG: methionine--tRNA ligase [Candidatus Pacebacteria bacterium]|nr:methionine--tRNA ligase [Candidatus Paceibacterota bacterium]